VPAFREVASALEEKEAKINDAEAYQFETEALSTGEADQRRRQAEGLAADRTQRAEGEAQRFIDVAVAHREGPVVDRMRLRLETTEKILSGRRKVIVDHPRSGAHRWLFLGPRGLWTMPPKAPAEAAYSEGQSYQEE